MKLSIAIPTYNRASFLVETLESILPQMQEDMEIVISDNGSTDDTLLYLKKYQEHYPIRVVGFEQNQGIDRNIMHVIEHARGEYIQLFADDDLLMPGSIEYILDEIKKSAPLIICLNHFAFKNHRLEERQPPFLPCKRKEFLSGEAFFKYCGLGFLSSLIIRREYALPLLKQVRLGKECAHLDIVSRIALRQKGVYIFLGDVLVAGRSLPIPRYDLMHSCVLYPKELYDELLEEKALSPSGYRTLVYRLLYKEIPRIVYKMLQASKSLSLRSLEEYFKTVPGAKWFLALLDLVNVSFLKKMFDVLFFGVCLYRGIKLLWSRLFNRNDTWDSI